MKIPDKIAPHAKTTSSLGIWCLLWKSSSISSSISFSYVSAMAIGVAMSVCRTVGQSAVLGQTERWNY